MRSILRRQRLPFSLILLAGTALRFFRLGADSLWYDETVSTALAGSPLPELIRHTAGDIHPPGYYILLRGWLLLTGYPAGHADPSGIGLEFAAGFFSLFFGVLLIALVYALARCLADPRVALIAAALVALSPYNVWYSQEVRMYTLGAGLGVITMYTLLNALKCRRGRARTSADNKIDPRLSAFIRVPIEWWTIYALAAAAGMYTLYYFAFLLIPLNLWALWQIAVNSRRSAVNRQRTADSRRQTADNGQRAAVNSQPAASSFHTCYAGSPASNLQPLILANLAAALLYAPWIPLAWRQATNPPVPPWRVAPNILNALTESWTALSLGQSAPAWLWPALVLTLALYGVGLVALWGLGADDRRPPTEDRHQPSAVNGPLSAVSGLPIATFGPLALILLISLATPLYHVRYLFTYSPAFYVVLAAGLALLWGNLTPLSFSPCRRWGSGAPPPSQGRGWGVGAGAAALIWLAAAGVTLHAFWTDPPLRADDHRGAVQYLQARWRPGDVVLANAGWSYTALTTYWDGPIAGRTRLTADLPAPRPDGALVMVTTGHIDGDPGLGWADPRSDFFALPADVAEEQIAALFGRFDRVWHYRIYDTVNDPTGRIRAWLAEDGQVFEDQVFPGEAFMRVQGFLPRAGQEVAADWPAAILASGLTARAGPLPDQVASGATVYPVLEWQFAAAPADFAVSVRLVAADGTTWAQGADERPAGPGYPGSAWPVGQVVRQTASLPIPPGTPPGTYRIELVVYDPATGQPWPAQAVPGGLAASPNGVYLGEVIITRAAEAATTNTALARFGPLALIEASTPATTVAAGGEIPLILLWQAADAPGEPLVVVVQLQDAPGAVAAGLEAEPAGGRYPTQAWAAGELVGDRHTLSLPPDLEPGTYQLIVGVYRAADRVRLETRVGLFGTRDHWTVKKVEIP